MEFKGEIHVSDFAWDTFKFLNMQKTHLIHVKDPEISCIIQKLFQEFEEKSPLLNKLRKSLIHNDANDTNIIMDKEGKSVLAFIDFGDILVSYTINDLAITLVYVLFKEKDVLSAMEQIVRAYNMFLHIQPDELGLLVFLMKVRLAFSILMSSHSYHFNPDNEYLISSQSAAIKLLKFLDKEIDNNYVHYLLRRACHYKFYCPQEEKLLNFCSKTEFFPIFGRENFKYQVLDLSKTSEFQEKMPKNLDKQTEYIFSYLESKGKEIGIGRYNEERSIYSTENYKVSSKESRTIHLGIDLFVITNTPIFSPLDGVVHSFGDSKLELDYGPVIILQHEVIEFKFTFYTLYGHLSSKSLKDLYCGKKIKKGEILGFVGNYPVNGNWPPHLHFQIINDMFHEKGNYIGVALKSKRDLWQSICPNPNNILKIPEEFLSISEYNKNTVLSHRNEHICKALSVSYDEPLFIMKGDMQYLIDDQNVHYLDGVNNVAHIGHSHPSLQKAMSKQFSLINTNTRYVSNELFEYSTELLKLFPKELNVCFFTNSGSEANDLALRLAKAYTKRKDLIVLNHAYHGNLTSLIKISPYKFQGKGGFECPKHVHVAELPDGYRGPFKYSDPKITENYVENVREILKNNPNKCAAFIAESISGCGGQIVFPNGYLQKVYEIVRNDGGVCIADEVQVGFGRMGNKTWGFETQNVIPDIVTLGKPIGNGYPLGAVVVRKEIAEKFANGMEYFNTFGGSNASCIVGLNVIRIMKEDKLQENALFLGKVLMEALNELKENFDFIGDVRGIGLFIGIEFVKNKKDLTLAPGPEELKFVVEFLKKNEQILVSIDGPLHNVLKLKPPLCWNFEDCARFVASLRRALERLQNNKE